MLLLARHGENLRNLSEGLWWVGYDGKMSNDVFPIQFRLSSYHFDAGCLVTTMANIPELTVLLAMHGG